jgi:hypothetical protein
VRGVELGHRLGPRSPPNIVHQFRRPLPPPVWPACSRATTALLLRAQLASRHQRHQRLRNLQLELESLAVERAASTSLRGELLVLGAGCVWGGGGHVMARCCPPPT